MLPAQTPPATTCGQWYYELLAISGLQLQDGRCKRSLLLAIGFEKSGTFNVPVLDLREICVLLFLPGSTLLEARLLSGIVSTLLLFENEAYVQKRQMIEKIGISLSSVGKFLHLGGQRESGVHWPPHYSYTRIAILRSSRSLLSVGDGKIRKPFDFRPS
ncbi:hypothetical protein BJ508DRAFT_332555 [Ascobolus immersus RN42]|uniref:Uncharacterized protein n=1 Tax=Ascobolus immersus RN42 TaxID=1160509 RepID=A0A3N4HMC6_ASCIM|nr:hypothetical protein BJ508DRAFT_332555 [Ascobolus immersus RN42]